MSKEPGCYRFADHTGYLVHPERTGDDVPVALGHTASVMPWQDADVQLHEVAEEFFILLRGELHFLVGRAVLRLRSGEMLVVRPGVPHAIVGGAGRIEHFGLRAPAVNDRHAIGPLPSSLPAPSHEEPRELRQEWGHRIPLTDGRNQNSWLLGAGAAGFACDHLALAYDNLQTAEAAAALPDTLRLHLASWAYYVVLQGRLIVLLDAHLISVEAGHVLEVPSGVSHAVCDRQVPFTGFTFRAPLTLDEPATCEKP